MLNYKFEYLQWTVLFYILIMERILYFSKQIIFEYELFIQNVYAKPIPALSKPTLGTTTIFSLFLIPNRLCQTGSNR